MKTTLTALLLVMAAFPARGRAEPAPASFDVWCKSSSSDFVIQFRSASGDVTEDDMSVTLKQGEKTISLPLMAAWYLQTGPMYDRKKLSPICQGTPAFELSPSRVLLFVRMDARPGFLRSSVVLFDPKAGRVLDVRENVGSMKESAMVFRAIPGGVEQRLVRHYIPNSGCDCAEAAIEDWQPIRVKGDKLVLGWKPDGY